MLDFFSKFRFCRLVQLLAGGGTKILRRLLEKLSAPMTFKGYMYQHQSEVFDLKLTKDQKDLIINKDVEKMDITLLCKLTLKLFKGNLTEEQIKLITGIKAERDKLAHSDLLETAAVMDNAFFARWAIVEKLLLDLSGTTGARQEMETFIDKIRYSEPDIDEIIETLRVWCRSSPDAEQNIGKLHEMLEQLRADCETYKLYESRYSFEAFEEFWDAIKVFIREYNRYKRSLETPDPFDAELKDPALDTLQSSNIVVLQGQKGSGKTKGAFSLSHTLIKDGGIKTDRCALIRKPSDVKELCPDLDLLIVDGVGNNPYMTPVWEESLRYLERLLGTSNVKVIITSRVAINLEFKTVKGTFKLASQTLKLSGLEPWPK